MGKIIEFITCMLLAFRSCSCGTVTQIPMKSSSNFTQKNETEWKDTKISLTTTTQSPSIASSAKFAMPMDIITVRQGSYRTRRPLKQMPCCIHGSAAGRYGLRCEARKDFFTARFNIIHLTKQKFMQKQYRHHLSHLSIKIEKCAQTVKMKRVFRKCCIKMQMSIGYKRRYY